MNTNDKRNLTSLGHIRLRPNMYLKLTPGAIYTLLKETINNGVDEHIMGAGQHIDIAFTDEGRVTVRDFGRGIPLIRIVEFASEIRCRAKSIEFPLSVGIRGMGGIGLILVNALSVHFTVTAFCDGQMATATFEKGVLINSHTRESNEKNGTLVEFLPDKQFFGDFAFNHECLRRMMWRYACLNSRLRLSLNGELFHSKNGLSDLLDMEIADNMLYTPPRYHDDILEIAFTHVNNYRASYYSFVNGSYTIGGGRHLSAFREGILKGVNEFSGKKFTRKNVLEGIVGAIAVKVFEPHIEKDTWRDKLILLENRADIVNRICQFVAECLHRDSALAEAMMAKINQNKRVDDWYSSRDLAKL